MAAIVSTLVLAGCTDDVYDPERGIQTVPKENPLGEDFSAPDSFDWSMINAINLNVEVKDEFNGRYKYLIEVFTDNPISNAGVTLSQRVLPTRTKATIQKSVSPKQPQDCLSARQIPNSVKKYTNIQFPKTEEQ